MGVVLFKAPSVELAIFENLARHAEAGRDAFAPATEKALKADTRVFSEWCSEAGLASLPASSITMAAFIDAMTLSRRPATIRRYCSSIAHLHRAAGVPNPLEGQEAKLALRRMGRTHPAGRAQRQAAPLNRPLLERLMAATTGPSPRSLRNRALLAVAYDSLCRQSELAALRVEDLSIASDGSGLITIRRSKTDQEGVGSVRYLGPDTARALTAWLGAAGSPTEGPLFTSVLRNGRTKVSLRGADVARIYKELASAAGLSAEEAARISGHSTRVGACQDMVAAGVELPAILQAGQWKSSEMVARYSRNLDARRSGSAKLAIMQNRA